MIPEYYEFVNTVKILSGRNALEHIPFELSAMGAYRPMILTDQMLVKIGLVQNVIDALGESSVISAAMYDRIPPDSSIAVVNDVARIYRETGCDSIIAVGGGSVIDTAKGATMVLSRNADDLMDYMGVEILGRRTVPFIVVPTTAGTGSEVTSVAVIANPEKQVKMEFVSPSVLPDAAVLDPRMTVSLPPRLTASTGMDALTHAIEAYTSVQKNPISDAFAFDAIGLIRDNLARAVGNGKDEEARMAMANASLMAGVAFSNAMVGIVHAAGHACGGVSHVPHAEAMAILLPHGMEYNMSSAGHLYAQLLLALAGPLEYAATPEPERAQMAVEIVREMGRRYNRECGLPTRLSEAGVKREDLPKIARVALNDGSIIVNPAHADEGDVLAILEKAF